MSEVSSYFGAIDEMKSYVFDMINKGEVTDQDMLVFLVLYSRYHKMKKGLSYAGTQEMKRRFDSGNFKEMTVRPDDDAKMIREWLSEHGYPWAKKMKFMVGEA